MKARTWLREPLGVKLEESSNTWQTSGAHAMLIAVSVCGPCSEGGHLLEMRSTQCCLSIEATVAHAVDPFLAGLLNLGSE
eukprot:5197825-Amphidinium_carterae.1